MSDRKIFLKEIEHLKISKQIDYIDAIIFWCDKNNVEIDLVANIINSNQVLKLKIQEEAEALNILKKGVRLPI